MEILKSFKKSLLTKIKGNIIRSIILGLIFIIIVIGILDSKDFDNYLYQILNIGHLTFYDLPFWEFLISFGTISAAGVALYASNRAINIERKQSEQIKKQLKIEQEPYVVIDGSIVLVGHGRHEVKIKNVGRGSAIRITCSVDKNNRDVAFFENTKSHAYYLSMNEGVTTMIDDSAISKIKQDPKGNFYFFYIFYKSQIGDFYETEVKMKLLPDKFVIMENNRKEI